MIAPTDPSLRRAVRFVAIANLAYFGVEFAVALSINSVSLVADSIDFLEDASINFLILLGLTWAPRWRARLGMTLAFVLLVPAATTLWTAWQKLGAPITPNPLLLSAAGLGALGVNLICAFVLARFRNHQGSLTQAAFLSARNDALANVAIISAGGATFVFQSMLPDLVVGLGIAALNAGAAWEVWNAAREEHRDAVS